MPDKEDGFDKFSLKTAATVADVVMEQCLVRRRSVGWEYPGRRQEVRVAILRMYESGGVLFEGGGVRDGGGGRRLRRVFEVGNGTWLGEETGTEILESVIASGRGNGTRSNVDMTNFELGRNLQGVAGDGRDRKESR